MASPTKCNFTKAKTGFLSLIFIPILLTISSQTQASSGKYKPLDTNSIVENKEKLDSSNDTLENGIQDAIKALNPNNPFAYFNLPLSKSEMDTFNQLKINGTEVYDNFGDINTLEDGVREFIKSLRNENQKNDEIENVVPQNIVKLVMSIIKASGKETGWVSVRSFTPKEPYAARWHTDGYYFEPYEGDPYKFAMTLKGNPTPFNKLPMDKRKEFFALLKKGNKENQYNQKAINDLVATSHETDSMGSPGQGAVFIVGSDNGAIHSEPQITEGRLFISVVPGSAEQIEELKKLWKR